MSATPPRTEIDVKCRALADVVLPGPACRLVQRPLAGASAPATVVPDAGLPAAVRALFDGPGGRDESPDPDARPREALTCRPAGFGASHELSVDLGQHAFVCDGLAHLTNELVCDG